MSRFTPTLSSASRRVVIGFGDQALNSFSNFNATVVGAATLSAPDFGRFSLIFALYLIANGIVRSVLSDPLVVLYPASAHETARYQSRRGVRLALVFGGTTGILLAVASLFLSGELRIAMLILAIGMPGLAMQDFLRYSCFTLAQPGRALANDGIWVL